MSGVSGIKFNVRKDGDFAEGPFSSLKDAVEWAEKKSE